jgi:CheY-like chemotaxis protein
MPKQPATDLATQRHFDSAQIWGDNLLVVARDQQRPLQLPRRSSHARGQSVGQHLLFVAALAACYPFCVLESIMPTRILVVDDEKGIVETLTAILQMKGYQVDAAFDGVDGYETARRFNPDLIISDISMPKLNGIEMAIKITAELAGVRILLFSGQAMTLELLQEARTRGYSFECLLKPFHPIDLINKVEALLGSAPAAA